MEEYFVPEEKRIELGNYLKKSREKIGFGLNQFTLKIGITSSLYSRLENGKLYKINPYLLQKIADGLKIDYKELYKIIGYLREEDFKNSIVNSHIYNSSNFGNVVNGNDNFKKISNLSSRTEILSDLSEEELGKVMEYVELLKLKRLKGL